MYISTSPTRSRPTPTSLSAKLVPIVTTATWRASPKSTHFFEPLTQKGIYLIPAHAIVQRFTTSIHNRSKIDKDPANSAGAVTRGDNGAGTQNLEQPRTPQRAHHTQERKKTKYRTPTGTKRSHDTPKTGIYMEPATTTHMSTAREEPLPPENCKQSK